MLRVVAVVVTAVACFAPASLHALPLDAPATPAAPASQFAPRPSDTVPPEVGLQLRQRQVASDSEAALDARNRALREVLARNSQDRYAMHELGTVLYHQGATKEAVALWSSASKAEPNLAPPEVMAAVQEVFSLLARGDTGTAQIKLAAAEKRLDRQPHFHLVRAEQAMRGGNLAEAEAAYRRAQALDPKLYVTALSMARFQEAARRDPALVRQHYEAAIKLAPKRADGWTALGAFLLRQKQTEPALEAFRKARSLDASAPLPEQRMGDASFGAGQFASARDWYLRALAAKPPLDEEAAIRTALGHALLRIGSLAQARDEFEAVLKSRELPAALFALATMDEAQGRLDAAEQRYRRVLALAPGNPFAANNLAMVLIQAGKPAAEALKLSEQANRDVPNNKVIQGTHGCALQHVGKSKEAIVLLETVVAASPADAWSRYCLGKALLAEKRAQDARVHLSAILKGEASFPRRAEVEKLLGGQR